MDSSNSESVLNQSQAQWGLAFRFLWVFCFAFTLDCKAIFSQPIQVLDAAGLDLEAILLHRHDPMDSTSLFLEWENLGRLRLTTEYSRTPSIQKNGLNTATVRSEQEKQTLYLSVGSQAEVKLGRYWKDNIFRYRDPEQYSAKLKSQQNEILFGTLYHFLNPNEPGPKLDLLLDFRAVTLLDYTLGFCWSRFGNLEKSGETRLEFLQTFRDARDEFQFEDLRPAGSGERVQGTYNASYQSSSFQAEGRRGPGIWAGRAVYSWSRPNRPQTEYSFTDSSQSLIMGASFRGGSHLSYLGYSYGEGQIRTFGLRIPPGSEGSKRFHYGFIQTSFQELRAESAPYFLLPHSSSSMGLAASEYTLHSTPSPEAFSNHKETLSYNRLGLSFIADVYGGFSRSGELIRMDGSVRQLEWKLKHIQWISSLCLEFSAPLILSLADFDLKGETRTHGPFSTQIDRTYRFGKIGSILSVTPRLTGEWDLDTWGEGKLKLGGKVAQVLFLWSDLADKQGTSSKGGGIGEGALDPGSTYPIFENGFFGELSLTLEY